MTNIKWLNYPDDKPYLKYDELMTYCLPIVATASVHQFNYSLFLLYIIIKINYNIFIYFYRLLITWCIILTGHPSCNQRHPLGMRSQSFSRQIRINQHDTATSEKRTMRNGPVGHPASMQHDGAGYLLSPPADPGHGETPHAPAQGPQLYPGYEDVVLRSPAPETTARGGRDRLHQYHALKTNTYLAPALRRFHRFPDESQGHLHIGAGRPYAVHAIDREHEGGV